MFKVIFEQSAKDLTKQKLLSVLIAVMFAVGLFLTIGIAGYYSQNQTKLSDFYKVYGEKDYKFKAGVMSTALGDQNMERIEACINYYRQIKTSTEFESYTFSNGSLTIFDYKGPDSCLVGYENYQPQRDLALIESDSVYSLAKAYMIDPGVFERFSLIVAVGKDFSDCSGIYDGSPIPVVMGWDYNGYYKLGEIFKARLPWAYNTVVSYEVVGFLPLDAAILPINNADEDLLRLSNTMFIPAYDITGTVIPDPQIDTKNHYAYDVYLNHLCDFILISKNNSIDLSGYGNQELIGKASSQRTMILTSSFMADANRYFRMLEMASILIVSGSCVCLALNLTNKLIANFKTYAIHQISGGTVGGQAVAMMLEVLILAALSNLIAYILALTLGKYVFSYNVSGIFGVQVTRIDFASVLAATAVSIFVCSASLAVPLIKLYRVEFDTLLRGRE
ncbi:MAG TPA: hypothetical protein PK854_06070 [Oscillospiraceae bacterium]|nr:hypothetical protein [Oscillospiraceae bacterium]HPS34812.1 hypothetical protein [Oscillospiraceae bacterium]